MRCFCMSLLRQIAVSFSPTKPAHFRMEREGPGQLSIQLLSSLTGYCGPIWGQYSVMWYVATLNTHLMTKCEIDNDVDSMPQWISEELFRSGKKYEDLKE